MLDNPLREGSMNMTTTAMQETDLLTPTTREANSGNCAKKQNLNLRPSKRRPAPRLWLYLMRTNAGSTPNFGKPIPARKDAGRGRQITIKTISDNHLFI